MQFKAQQIPGKSNIIADSISCKQWEVIQEAAPNAGLHPSSISSFNHFIKRKFLHCIELTLPYTDSPLPITLEL